MGAGKGFLGLLTKRILLGGVSAVALFILAKLFHFPLVFQIMFVIYAFLGTAVFILLDAPALSPLSGFKAIAALVAFYGVISVVYTAATSILPQYDPMVEKGKIDKIVKPKLAATEKAKMEELLKRNEELTAENQALLKRLETLRGGEKTAAVGSAKAGAGGRTKPAPAAGDAKPAPAAGDLVALGKEQYDLQECYNCHKIGGTGSVKKRGPELDNIGNLMKPEELKEKILNPLSWMAEGFEKEYEKKQMPDKYKELMSEAEIDALVAYMATLKDASVQTPNPVKKR
jgi:mono/diheme cytochrome c family protein